MKALVNVNNSPYICLDEIPKHEVDSLARSTLRAVERYFELPNVKKDYERWLEEYKCRIKKRI